MGRKNSSLAMFLSDGTIWFHRAGRQPAFTGRYPARRPARAWSANILRGATLPISQNPTVIPPRIAAQNVAQYKNLFDWAAKRADTRAKFQGGVARLCEILSQLGLITDVLLFLAFAIANTRSWLMST
jgi:hypothetical protein